MADQVPPRLIEQRGLWFEEFEEGVVYRHRPGRTLTEADNQLFSALTMNQQALHVDAQWSESAGSFSGQLMNSLMTLSTLIGLTVNQLTQGTIVANLGFTDVRFPLPVRHGDTLNAESVVVGKRLSKSRPGEGIVSLVHTGRNQNNEVVVVANRTVLMQCRPA